MLISLVLTGAVLALAAHMALSQLRFFVGVTEIVGVRTQIGHATAVVSRALWGISPAAGDIIVAMDSALEIHATIGSAVVCQASIGRATIAAPVQGYGNALAAFFESPAVGDRVHVFFDDSLGSGWLTLNVATAPAAGGSCLTFPQVAATWTLELREPVTLQKGAALRVTRPLRLSLYRGSDSKWYLGARDWNSESGQFNSPQPVAGPLRPYSANPDKTGFLLIFRDAAGAVLDPPVDVLRVASVTITSRTLSLRPMKVWSIAPTTAEAFGDSVSVAISPRNAR